MSDWSMALDDLFNDVNMAVDAVFTAAGADAVAVPVRVLFTNPDQAFDSFGVGAVASTATAEIRVAQVAEVREGATLAIGSEVYRVRGPMRPDANRLVWRFSLARS